MHRLTIVLVLVIIGATAATAQPQSKTYAETRRLLLEMERDPANKALAKLFEEGDVRRPDLIRALYDPEQKVRLNAQSIIKYLAEPETLAALDEWYQYRKAHTKEYWISPVELLAEVRLLSGDDSDLTKLVLHSLHPNEKDFSAELIAHNKNRDTALIEIVEGNIFTTGWHAVIRRENGKWWLLSHYLVWES